MSDRPLTIQGDRTMLLDVHSPSAASCREDIMSFSDLVKSPEHIHTYQLSALSLWNAISSGITTEEILTRLRRWSRYEIDERIIYFQALPSMKWIVVMDVSSAEVFAPLHRMLRPGPRPHRQRGRHPDSRLRRQEAR